MVARLFILSVFGSLLIFGLARQGPLREHFDSGNLRISLTEDKEMVRLQAFYPKASARSVHAYIKKHFNLVDIDDFSKLEIRRYQTPDGSMKFYIKSRDGFLKIEMDKGSNSEEAWQLVRDGAEGVKKAIAGV